MDYLERILDIFILIFEVAGAAMIIYGGIRGALGLVKIESSDIHQSHITSYEGTLQTNSSSALSSSSLQTSLSTIIAPNFEDILLLGAIVAIRVVLSYFLSKETLEYPMTDTCELFRTS